MSIEGCAKTEIDRRSPWQRRTDALWAAAKWQTYLLYCRTLYRPHMRLIHRFGWHWHKHLNLIDDGSEQLWCQWCGDRWTRKPLEGPKEHPPGEGNFNLLEAENARLQECVRLAVDHLRKDGQFATAQNLANYAGPTVCAAITAGKADV